MSEKNRIQIGSFCCQAYDKKVHWTFFSICKNIQGKGEDNEKSEKRTIGETATGIGAVGTQDGGGKETHESGRATDKADKEKSEKPQADCKGGRMGKGIPKYRSFER